MGQIIQVANVEDRKTGTGKFLRVVTAVDGTKYSIWDAKITAVPGMAILAETESNTDGNGKTWYKIVSVSTPPNSTPLASNGKLDAKSLDIHRQVALKCAVEATGQIREGVMTGVDYCAVVFDLAERFECWLNLAEDEPPF